MKQTPPDLTAEDVRVLGVALFGERGWQSRLADALGVHRAQVGRWMRTGRIPGPVRCAIASLKPVQHD